MEGRKDLLGMYVSHSEGADFGLNVLTDLQNQGVRDVLIACVDSLTGFPDAINSVFPNTDVQLFIVHPIRNSVKYVGSKSRKEFLANQRCIYAALTRDAAELALDKLGRSGAGSTQPSSSPGVTSGRISAITSNIRPQSAT